VCEEKGSLMSHLHIPDGVLPLWLVVAGWLLTAAAVALSLRFAAGADLRRRVPLVGAVGALMLVGMSSEIVPIAYHINLTVVAGVLLGPALCVPAALVVVTMLALIGHGGVTVIGLNTLVIGSEMLLGWLLFSSISHVIGRERAGWSAGIATVLTLFATTTLVIGIVALGGAPSATRQSGAFDPATLRFENPFAEGVLGKVVVEGEEEAAAQPLAIGRFALTLYALGSIGWVLEALVSAALLGFLARVRPSLVFESGTPVRSRLGDEGVHR
jgi:cobalt/nickel transport system permease protein